MTHGILIHEPDDDVGVAVQDLGAGADVGVITLEGAPVGTVTLLNDVPLGHKVAMHDLAIGHDVIEYGRVIGVAFQGVPRGSHVHTHNIRTKRWMA
ncbi:MAG TPA: UxaA family hydrolase [Vicinamibacterales bacterium]|nr:UxaA family hydrolase [Vicinamibacterales bacterium]